VKKAQILTKPVTYIAILVIISLFVVWSVGQFNKINQSAEEARLTSFTKSLENILTSAKSTRLGDVDEKTFSIPDGATEMCFVDETIEIDEFANLELTSQRRMFPGFNIFIFPSNKFNPLSVDRLRVYEYNNPLCVKTTNGKVKLSFENKGKFSEINAENPVQETDCVSLAYNGDPSNKIDVVFLGYAYDDSADFAEDVERYIQGQFVTVEPFSTQLTKLNFYRIDSFDESLCWVDNIISCDNYEAKKLASQCPNDYVFILAADQSRSVRSSAVGNLIKVNTADKERVVIHEFGHAFANLADEYVDENYYGSINFRADNYPNCDIGECSKWISEQDVSCLRGCSLNSFFRSTENSIMRNLREALVFGPVNTKEIIKSLERYE